jgi:hypothetical protein
MDPGTGFHFPRGDMEGGGGYSLLIGSSMDKSSSFILHCKDLGDNHLRDAVRIDLSVCLQRNLTMLFVCTYESKFSSRLALSPLVLELMLFFVVAVVTILHVTLLPQYTKATQTTYDLLVDCIFRTHVVGIYGTHANYKNLPCCLYF